MPDDEDDYWRWANAMGPPFGIESRVKRIDGDEVTVETTAELCGCCLRPIAEHEDTGKTLGGMKVYICEQAPRWP